MGDKALLFLDVDGVINGDSRRFSERRTIHFSPEELAATASPFGREGGESGLDLQFWLDPRSREWVQQLSEYFELVWASTWEHLANTYVSPLLGLGELRVVEHSKVKPTFGEVKDHNVAQWKWRAIVPFAQGRDFAFVDDQARPLIALLRALRDDKKWELGSGEPLVLAPKYGLSGADMIDLLAFGKTCANRDAAL
jgi:hypothetical protein